MIKKIALFVSLSCAAFYTSSAQATNYMHEFNYAKDPVTILHVSGCDMFQARSLKEIKSQYGDKIPLQMSEIDNLIKKSMESLKASSDIIKKAVDTKTQKKIQAELESNISKTTDELEAGVAPEKAFSDCIERGRKLGAKFDYQVVKGAKEYIKNNSDALAVPSKAAKKIQDSKEYKSFDRLNSTKPAESRTKEEHEEMDRKATELLNSM